MLPINRRYPLGELFEACRDYVNTTRRRITYEWALIQELNDTPEQAQLLVKRLRGMLCHVNVIPLNPTRQYSGQATTRQRAVEFQAELVQHGIPCTIRLKTRHRYPGWLRATSYTSLALLYAIVTLLI